jgi:hypothetical protein
LKSSIPPPAALNGAKPQQSHRSGGTGPSPLVPAAIAEVELGVEPNEEAV